MVQLLVSAGADIDSQDNRKVSCLMAAFRKGHIKVVKWMVKHVAQFPSDSELQRFIATITDKVIVTITIITPRNLYLHRNAALILFYNLFCVQVQAVLICKYHMLKTLLLII